MQHGNRTVNLHSCKAGMSTEWSAQDDYRKFDSPDIKYHEDNFIKTLVLTSYTLAMKLSNPTTSITMTQKYHHAVLLAVGSSNRRERSQKEVNLRKTNAHSGNAHLFRSFKIASILKEYFQYKVLWTHNIQSAPSTLTIPSVKDFNKNKKSQHYLPMNHCWLTLVKDYEIHYIPNST